MNWHNLKFGNIGRRRQFDKCMAKKIIVYNKKKNHMKGSMNKKIIEGKIKM